MTLRWILTFLAAASCSFAQVDRSTLTGTVHDTTGGVLPGVQVSATNRATGVERKTHATEWGVYILPDLPIGTYTVIFSTDGFRRALYEAVEQTVGQTRIIDPVLAVSGRDSQITIEETIPQVDRSSASLSESIEQRAVQDIPL